MSRMAVRIFRNELGGADPNPLLAKGDVLAAPAREEISGLRIRTKLPGGFAECSFTFKGKGTLSGRLEASRWRARFLSQHLEVNESAEVAFYGLIDEMTHDQLTHSVQVLARGYYSTLTDRRYTTTSASTGTVKAAIGHALTGLADGGWRGSFMGGGTGQVTDSGVTVPFKLGDTGLETAQEAIEQWLALGDASNNRYWPAVWSSRTLRVDQEAALVSWYCRNHQMAQAQTTVARSGIWNHVVVSYVDTSDNVRKNSSAAQDTASQGQFGRRDLLYPAGELSAAAANQLAATILAKTAWPRELPALTLSGSVLDLGMAERPLWMVRAGHALKALDLELPDSPAGATVWGRNTWIIRETVYDADADTLEITPELPQQTLPNLLSQALSRSRMAPGQAGDGTYLSKVEDDATGYKLATGRTSAHGTAQFYVKKGAVSGEPTWADEDTLILENASAYNTVLNILSANNKRGGIAFSDPDDRIMGGLSYDHGDETLRLFTQNVLRLALSATLAKFETLIDFPEQGSSPAAPASGYLRLFPKSADNSLYLKTSAGAERKIYHDGNLVAFVASGSSHAAGLVPDPGASAGTTKFLCEDGTFKTVTSASGVVQTPLGHDISVLPNVISHWPILDTVLGGTSVPDVNGAHSATTTNAIGSVGRPWYNTQGQVWLSAASVQSLASVGSLITEARDASCYWMGWIFVAGEVNATWRLFGIPQSGTGSGANTPFTLYLDSPASRLNFGWQHSTNANVTTTAEIAAGLRHVCAMREHGATSTASIYIDGELAVTASGLTNPSGGGSLTVARLAHSASPTGEANHAVLGDCVWGSGGLPSAAQIRTQYRRGMGSY